MPTKSRNYKKTVYVLGAGISAEVGVPVVRKFLKVLLREVPPSKSRRLRTFLQKKYGTLAGKGSKGVRSLFDL